MQIKNKNNFHEILEGEEIFYHILHKKIKNVRNLDLES